MTEDGNGPARAAAGGARTAPAPASPALAASHVPTRGGAGIEVWELPTTKHGDGTKDLILSMGPQHPSTHGVLRLQVHLDGEKVLAVDPDIGYLHRSWEKIVESWQYPQVVPFTDRNDYLGSMMNEQVYCMAVEQLMGIEVPPRAEYLRVIFCEWQRVISHLIWLGTFCLDLGATTAFLWAFRERERIYALFELQTGGRMFPSYLRIGGVRSDLSQQARELMERLLADLPKSLAEYHGLLSGNPIFRARLAGVGKLPAGVALSYGVSGPMLRASGVPFDVRKADPYSVYEHFQFDVPVGKEGDTWDRYEVRMKEIEESLKIVRQALDALPPGEIMGKVPRVYKPPPGDCYVHVESPRGELGCFLVSNGSKQPYRVKWRSPCFANLQALKAMAPGLLLADLVAVLGSIDIVLGEVDL